MLLILEPFALVLLAIDELVDSPTLPSAFDVLAFVIIAVRINGLAYAMWLALQHFPLVFATIGKCIVAYLNLLGMKAKNSKTEKYM